MINQQKNEETTKKTVTRERTNKVAVMAQ